MTHIDRDDLALIAMAEQGLTESERLHLAECPECSLDLIALQHTIAVGRSARSVELVEPGAAVWGRIHSALGLSVAVAQTPRLSDYEGAALKSDAFEGAASSSAWSSASASTATDAASHAPGVPPDTAPAPAAPAPAVPEVVVPEVVVPEVVVPKLPEEPVALETPVAPVIPLRRPRSRRTRSWLPLTVAAAIVGLIGGLGGGIWWESLRPDAPPPADAKIAEATLDPYPGWDAGGSAYVARAADGHREVVVDLTGASGNAPLREVWLIKADATGLVSIGLLDGNTGRFTIPDGIDLAQYPLVDVSAEPANGDPAHSGDSIVRGQLRAT